MPRKASGARAVPPERVTLEIYPDDRQLVRQAKADAALRGETFREWVLRAMALRLEVPRE